MVYSLTWLPEILDRANLKFSEVAEWRTRGRAEMGRVRGVMIHHTGVNAGGNMPTLNSLIRGRPDLRGPLANLGLGRDGTFYIVAAGRANHAGTGVWRGITSGNGSFIGIEVENRGTPDDRYPDVQLDALCRGVAAILKHIGAEASMVCGHKEYAPARKIDPLWDMPAFRGVGKRAVTRRRSARAIHTGKRQKCASDPSARGERAIRQNIAGCARDRSHHR